MDRSSGRMRLCFTRKGTLARNEGRKESESDDMERMNKYNGGYEILCVSHHLQLSVSQQQKELEGKEAERIEIIYHGINGEG